MADNILRTDLCIGGPIAGSRYAVQHGVKHFRVAIRPDLTVLDLSKPPPSTVSVESVEYVIDYLHFSPEHGQTIQFWRPSDQSSFETIKLLFETFEKFYHPGTKVKKR